VSLAATLDPRVLDVGLIIGSGHKSVIFKKKKKEKKPIRRKKLIKKKKKNLN
jgi:pheromone shutdown protein TraB